MDFDKLNNEILALDESIRYSAIQNSSGEKICGEFKENVKPILSPDELRMMHYYASQRWETRKKIQHKLGNAKYAMAEYEKLKRITFPINEKFLLMVTTEVGVEHQQIINAILDTIKKHSTSE